MERPPIFQQTHKLLSKKALGLIAADCTFPPLGPVGETRAGCGSIEGGGHIPFKECSHVSKNMGRTKALISMRVAICTVYGLGGMMLVPSAKHAIECPYVFREEKYCLTYFCRWVYSGNIQAATPKFEVKRPGISGLSNDCMAVPLSSYSASNFAGAAYNMDQTTDAAG
jgi:hypothetical protein